MVELMVIGAIDIGEAVTRLNIARPVTAPIVVDVEQMLSRGQFATRLERHSPYMCNVNTLHWEYAYIFVHYT